MKPRHIVSGIFLLIVPGFVLAHGNHGSGFIAGFTHPIFGLDHSIAILGLSFLGYLVDRTRWYIIPLSFIITMVIGGMIGIDHTGFPGLEKLIAITVILVGLSIVSVKEGILPYVLLALLAGGLHGYAHGIEMPVTNTIMKYVSGFTLGALLLTVIGRLTAPYLENYSKYRNVFGGFIMGTGFIFFSKSTRMKIYYTT